MVWVWIPNAHSSFACARQENTSKYSISLGLWTSGNQLALIGIYIHYIDKHYIAKCFLLDLLEITGAHSGENIAETVLEVLDFYGIASRVRIIFSCFSFSPVLSVPCFG